MDFKKTRMRVGNYVLLNGRDRKGVCYVSVSAVSGMWSVKWIESTMMYNLLVSLMLDNKTDGLENLLFLMFATTSYPHSAEFYLGLKKLIEEEVEKVAKEKVEVDEKSDKGALDEVVMMEEIADELNKSEDGES